MGMLLPTLALLVGAATAGAGSAAGARGDAASDIAVPSLLSSPARRIDGGTSVTVTVSARIISDSARIGAGLAPPLPGMVARRATIASSSGRTVPALIYDFE